VFVIGCDPSTKHFAFAVFENKHFIYHIKIEATYDNAKKFFDGFINQDFIFAVEDQFLNLNVLTLIKLVEVRAMLTTLASVYLANKILVIPPQQWQMKYLGVGSHSSRKQRKTMSCLVASSIAGEKISDIDIADAVCICDYAVKLQSDFGLTYQDSNKKIKKFNLRRLR
jgi:Holliday junction resolvasome RuvABC endonuclease subunit